MTSSDLARRALYARLEEVLGRENAETLMTHLPPQTPDNLATKADIAATRDDIQGLESRFDGLEARFDRMEDRFDRMEDRFDRMEDRFYGLQETMREQYRTYSLITIGALTALTGIFSAIVVIVR